MIIYYSVSSTYRTTVVALLSVCSARVVMLNGTVHRLTYAEAVICYFVVNAARASFFMDEETASLRTYRREGREVNGL